MFFSQKWRGSFKFTQNYHQKTEGCENCSIGFVVTFFPLLLFNYQAVAKTCRKEKVGKLKIWEGLPEKTQDSVKLLVNGNYTPWGRQGKGTLLWVQGTRVSREEEKIIEVFSGREHHCWNWEKQLHSGSWGQHRKASENTPVRAERLLLQIRDWKSFLPFHCTPWARQ